MLIAIFIVAQMALETKVKHPLPLETTLWIGSITSAFK